MAGDADLDGVFNPKSVAVVGVSASSSRRNMAETYLRALIECKFGGRYIPLTRRAARFMA